MKKKSMSLQLTDEDMALLEELSAKKEMSKVALIRQALRLYSHVDKRLSVGQRMYFEGDDEKSKSELMVL